MDIKKITSIIKQPWLNPNVIYKITEKIEESEGDKTQSDKIQVVLYEGEELSFEQEIILNEAFYKNNWELFHIAARTLTVSEMRLIAGKLKMHFTVVASNIPYLILALDEFAMVDKIYQKHTWVLDYDEDKGWRVI